MRVLSVRWSDDGDITIDWADEHEMKKEGGEVHSIYVTPQGQSADEQVAYYVKELNQDVDELLGHIRKMLGTR